MFNLSDFDVFDDETLDGRLAKIRSIIDPKFEKFGSSLIYNYQKNFNNELYMHIAKHARRYKNPPPDTWLAINMNKRGYKKYPHIEIGFWKYCMFANLSLLSDIDLQSRKKIIERLDLNFLEEQEMGISNDHTNSELKILTEENFKAAVERYLHVKSADLVIGYKYEKAEFVESTNLKMKIDLEKFFKVLKKFDK